MGWLFLLRLNAVKHRMRLSFTPSFGLSRDPNTIMLKTNVALTGNCGQSIRDFVLIHIHRLLAPTEIQEGRENVGRCGNSKQQRTGKRQ